MSDVHRKLSELSRRELIATISALGAAAALGLPEHTAAATPQEASRLAAVGRGTAARAAQTAPHGSDLGAVEHVVFLMMENRSYDHFFGAYPKGRGFDDHPKHSLGNFAQDYPAGTMLSRARSCCPSTSSCRPATTAPTTSRTTGVRCTSAGTTARWTASSGRTRRR